METQVFYNEINPKISFQFRVIVCSYYGFVSSWLALNSIACLTAVSLERYLVISRPFLERRLTLRRKLFYAMVTWVYSFLLSVPPIVGISKYKLEGYGISCSFDHFSRDKLTRSYIFYLFWGGLVAPVCLIAFSYTGIFMHLRKSQKFRKLRKVRSGRRKTRSISIDVPLNTANSSTQVPQHFNIESNNTSASGNESLSHSQFGEAVAMQPMEKKSRRLSKNEVHLAKIVLLVTFVFIISWAPYSVMSILAQFGPEGTINAAIMSVTSILAKISVVHNPIIYWFKDDDFRATVRRLFRFPTNLNTKGKS